MKYNNNNLHQSERGHSKLNKKSGYGERMPSANPFDLLCAERAVRPARANGRVPSHHTFPLQRKNGFQIWI